MIVIVIFSCQTFCTSFNHFQSPELPRTPNTNGTKLDLSSFILAKVVEDDEALQFLGGKHSFVNACFPKMDSKTLGGSQTGSFAVLFRCRSRRKIGWVSEKRPTSSDTTKVVFSQNYIWETNTEIPYWCRNTTQIQVPLIGWKFTSTNKKYYPDLGSNALSVWNFYAYIPQTSLCWEDSGVIAKY